MSDNTKFRIRLVFLFMLGLVNGFLSYKHIAIGKSECEQNLPRNQQCVIKWVPEEKK